MKHIAERNAQLPERSARVVRSKTRTNSQSRTRNHTGIQRPKLHLQNILVPTDFSEPSRKALRYAVILAKKLGSKITLLHVIEPMVVSTGATYPVMMNVTFGQAEAESALHELCRKEHVDQRLLRNAQIRRGTPHQEITDAAHELKADLILIATYGLTGLAHVVLGSTTERVVRHAPCPVLVVREKERDLHYLKL